MEAPVALQKRQQRPDVKTVGHSNLLGKGLGEAKGTEEIYGKEQRQTIALFPPEQDISRKGLCGFHQGLDFLGTQTPSQQLFLRLPEQVSEPDLVLLTLRAGAEGRHENRDAPSLVFRQQSLPFFLR